MRTIEVYVHALLGREIVYVLALVLIAGKIQWIGNYACFSSIPRRARLAFAGDSSVECATLVPKSRVVTYKHAKEGP